MFGLWFHDVSGYGGGGDEASVGDGDVLVDGLGQQYLRLRLRGMVVGMRLTHGGHVLVVTLHGGGGRHRHRLVTVRVLLCMMPVFRVRWSGVFGYGRHRSVQRYTVHELPSRLVELHESDGEDADALVQPTLRPVVVDTTMHRYNCPLVKRQTSFLVGSGHAEVVQRFA